MIRNHSELLRRIRVIHAAIRDTVVAACEQTAIERLAVPLDVWTNVAWIGYANAAIREQVALVLPTILREHGLLAAKGKSRVAD